MIYELKPIYDTRQSFYGKAIINYKNNGTIELYSYNTLVAYIKDNKPSVGGWYSQTTLRHIKEFLRQHGYKAESKAQILKDYSN